MNEIKNEWNGEYSEIIELIGMGWKREEEEEEEGWKGE